MADFASSEKDKLDLYKIIIGSVVPRPIAFVATMGKDGVANLSPFSFFNGVTYNPPTLAFSVLDRGSEMKDTSRNISANPEFIVHIVSESISEKMNVTCGDYGAHVDEFVEAGFTPVPGTMVAVPRVVEAMVAMECRLMHHIRIGEGTPQTSHILGEVVYWHVDEKVLTETGRIDSKVLQAVGRMGGNDYTRTADQFTMERPVIPAEDPRSIAAYQAALARPPQK